MSDIIRPSTPPHPGPDDEIKDSDSQVDLQDIEVPDELQRANDLLDLDNDDESDSDLFNGKKKVSESEKDLEELEDEDYNVEDNNDAYRLKFENSNTEIEDSESLLSHNSNSSVSEIIHTNDMFPPQTGILGRRSSIDFDEIDRRKYSKPINPFNTSRQNNASNISNKNIENYLKIINNEKYQRLSQTQQFKLLTHLDSNLLVIQKKFIKFISGETNYPFITLLNDLNDVILLIWYSIFQVKSIPTIYHGDNNTTVNLPDLSKNFQNIGQVEYLVKIMGDFNDYLTKYNFTKFDELNRLIQFLNQLDNFIVVLIDYDNDPNNNNNTKLIRNTALVRIESIINQTKLTSLSKFDKFKLLKVREILDNDDQITGKETRDSLAQLEIEIGQIYEGVLDKTSI